MLKGLGSAASFGRFHPMVTTIYYLLIIGLTMFSNRPEILMISMVGAFVYQFLLKGKDKQKSALIMGAVILLVTTVVNGFFTHNGQTVLFYIGPNRITLEAILFGLTMSMMIVAVIWWFASFNVIMSSDKLIYIFGKMAPVLGLVISMIFRFIPLLRSRYAEISAGQKCMRRDEEKGFVNRGRILMKEVSILIAWSLEASIESADSMTARGYGLKGRTSFHLFKWTAEDIVAVIVIGSLGVVGIIGYALGYGHMEFYPAIAGKPVNVWDVIVLADIAILSVLPLGIDLIGDQL